MNLKYVVVIPAHNEAQFVGLTLQSLVDQTYLPYKVIVVNDNSTDTTAEIVEEFFQKYGYISLINTISDTEHLPGSKVIRAFQVGFDTLGKDFDIVVKLDADLILPVDYFETILEHFDDDMGIGMVGGFAYIENEKGEWVLENLTDKDHIRGAFKAYRRACFEEIGGLKPAMGWDTVDELLCHFYGWKVVTDVRLQVKHLKPTGSNYNNKARYKQGEAFYSLGYGFIITCVSSAKLAFMKKKPSLFIDYMLGFCQALWARKPLLVSPVQAKFIREYRWQKMKQKLVKTT
jgi:glycosyltransferase involved in cell wall biosynthesis